MKNASLILAADPFGPAAQSAQSNDFAALLESFSAPVKPQPGTLIQGTVVRISDRYGAWVDFGGKSDALVSKDEMGTTPLAEGQTALFFVLDADSDEDATPVFSAKRAQVWSDMNSHLENRTSVGVKVTKVARNGSNGIAGVQVRSGELNGFVPYSLLGVRGKAVDDLVGQELQVKVTEVSPERRKLIFSHTDAMQEINAEKERQRTELFASLKEGEVRTATVVKLVEYGAFVDVGLGLHGLVHRTEISSDTKCPIGDLIKVGDVTDVKVLEAKTAADGKRRLALSIKQVQQGAFLGTVKVGDVLTGTVSRSVAFGVFVELSSEHGVDGLVHRSEFSSAVRFGRKTLNVGESLRVKVVSLDEATGRIGLSLKEVPQGSSGTTSSDSDASATDTSEAGTTTPVV